LTWHIHEMLFGFVMAAIARFMLTAIPNWTGRAPISGWPLGCAGGVMARGPLRMSDLGLAGCGNRSRFSIRAVRGRCPDHRAYVSAHAVLRVVAAISGSLFVLIQISATLWIGSFALFALWYGHVLLTPPCPNLRFVRCRRRLG
jgi:uncharacterized protein involved in response to NO